MNWGGWWSADMVNTYSQRCTCLFRKTACFRNNSPQTDLSRKYNGSMSLPFLKAELLTASIFALNHSPLRSFQSTKNWKHARLNIYKGDSPSRFIFQQPLPVLALQMANSSSRTVSCTSICLLCSDKHASLLLAMWYWLVSAVCMVSGDALQNLYS